MQMAGPKTAYHFPHLSACLVVHLYLSRAQYYMICYYPAVVYQQLLRFIGQATASVVLCCLDDEQVEGSYDNYTVFTN